MENFNEDREYDTRFRDYLWRSQNYGGLKYMNRIEAEGHELTIRGSGYIEYVILDCIYGYDVFEKPENRAIMAEILQTSSSIGAAAVTFCYCLIPGSAHLLVKGDTEQAVKTYVAIVTTLFEERYDNGRRSVGYPFKPVTTFNQMGGTRELWNTMLHIYGLSPDSVQTYPYNSFAYVMQGNTLANLVMGVELSIVHPKIFENKLLSKVRYGKYLNNAPEKFNTVMKDMQKRYSLPNGQLTEDMLALVIGETCARTREPYFKVTKKMKCYEGRHDLTISVTASYILRRRCSFDRATSDMGMGTEDPRKLLLETIIEINRLTDYSYEYITRQLMRVDDGKYEILVSVFRLLNEAYGYGFHELCQKFHIVKDIMYIGTRCGI